MHRAVLLFLLLPLLSVLGAELPFQVSLLENDILHVQASDVGKDFASELESSTPTNQIAGTVLDLRFAYGDQAILATDYFTGQKSPLVILINGETRGAAATLAEQLRSDHKAILIGSTNPPGAITPDVIVNVDQKSEKTFQSNPYAGLKSNDDTPPVATNTFLPFIDHTSEADLVRQRLKDSEDFDDPLPTEPKTQPRVIQDPELARAVDLLKALSVLNKSRG